MIKSSLKLLILPLLSSYLCLGAPGTLDPSFGSHGQVLTGFKINGTSVSAQSLAAAVQRNVSPSKIILAGSVVNSLDSKLFALARYNGINGGLDTTFNNAGTAPTLGSTATVIPGTVVTQVGNNAQINGVQIQGDGNIVAAGYTFINNIQQFALARYLSTSAPGLPAGSLDPMFGTNGIVVTPFTINNSPAQASASAIALQNDGKIVVAGFAKDHAGNTYFAVARYLSKETQVGSQTLPAGNLDTSFNPHGLGPDGLTPNVVTPGTVLTEFTINDSPVNSQATTLVITDDTIILGGFAFNPITKTTNFAVARYLATASHSLQAGSLDSPMFNPQGIGPDGRTLHVVKAGTAITQITVNKKSVNAQIGALLIEKDKLVAAGLADDQVTNHNNFIIARYLLKNEGALQPGTLDPSFNPTGQASVVNSAGQRVTINLKKGTNLTQILSKGAPIHSRITSLALQTDGSLLAGGLTSQKINDELISQDFVLSSYTPQGILDPGFGNKGIVLTDFSNRDDELTSVKIIDGKIIAPGFSTATSGANQGRSAFALARHFGPGGIAPTSCHNNPIVRAIFNKQCA